ncbi:MAG: hypothetical protein ACRDHW_11150, partial [Ktedonobacteraceae bacterium]
MNVKNAEKPTTNAGVVLAKASVRQPLTRLGKVAFWTFFAGTILSGVLVLILTIFNGSPSRDSVIVAVCWLACALLIVSGVRWLQALSIPLSAYI